MCIVEFHEVWKSFMLYHERVRSISDAIMHMFHLSSGKELFWALRGVSFQIKRGEMVGIIGPNGAGKSTILHLISQVMRPNCGQVQVRGRVAPLITAGSGFHQELTGRENIYLQGIIMGMTTKEIDQKLDRIVAFSEVEKFIDIPLKRYTPGMYLRLGFSITTHVDPDIFVVDEILAVGDTRFQKKCLNKIVELKRNGAAIIFVSHNLTMVEHYCDQGIFMKDGVIQFIGRPKEAVGLYKEFIT